jgi:hypothetical protein
MPLHQRLGSHRVILALQRLGRLAHKYVATMPFSERLFWAATIPILVAYSWATVRFFRAIHP